MQTLHQEHRAGVPEGAERQSRARASRATAGRVKLRGRTVNPAGIKYLLLKKNNYTLITLTQTLSRLLSK